ncbi:hypothetical protein BDAP_001239 [Binucleata daphniae]
MIFLLISEIYTKSVIFFNKDLSYHIGYPAPSDSLSLVKMTKDYDEGQADFIIEKSEIPDKYYIRYNDNPSYVLGVIKSSNKDVENEMHLTRLGFHKGLQNLLFGIKKDDKCLNIIFEDKCATWGIKNADISFDTCKYDDNQCFTFIALGK